jgi:hypothetical protein
MIDMYLGRVLHICNGDKDVVVHFDRDSTAFSLSSIRNLSFAYPVRIYVITLQRNLISAQIARGKKKVVIVGHIDAHSPASGFHETDSQLLSPTRSDAVRRGPTY